MADHPEDNDPFEEDIVFDEAGLLGGKMPRARRQATAGFLPTFMLFIRTVFLCVAFLGLGMCVSVSGGPLIKLEMSVGVPESTAFHIFTARSVGMLLGGALGSVLFEVYNRQFLLSVSLVWVAAAVTVLPFTVPAALWWTLASTAALGTGLAFLFTGGNVLCLDLWGRRQGGAALQALHFSFSLGALGVPLVVQPFFSGLHPAGTPNTTLSTLSTPLTMEVTPAMRVIRAAAIKGTFEPHNGSVTTLSNEELLHLTQPLDESQTSTTLPKGWNHTSITLPPTALPHSPSTPKQFKKKPTYVDANKLKPDEENPWNKHKSQPSQPAAKGEQQKASTTTLPPTPSSHTLNITSGNGTVMHNTTTTPTASTNTTKDTITTTTTTTTTITNSSSTGHPQPSNHVNSTTNTTTTSAATAAPSSTSTSVATTTTVSTSTTTTNPTTTTSTTATPSTTTTTITITAATTSTTKPPPPFTPPSTTITSTSSTTSTTTAKSKPTTTPITTTTTTTTTTKPQTTTKPSTTTTTILPPHLTAVVMNGDSGGEVMQLTSEVQDYKVQSMRERPSIDGNSGGGGGTPSLKPDTYSNTSDDKSRFLDHMAQRLGDYGVTRFHLAYISIGILVVVDALVSVVVLCHHPREARSRQEGGPMASARPARALLFTVLFSTFMFAAEALQGALHHLLATTGDSSWLPLSWSGGEGPDGQVVFWGLVCLVRFLCVPAAGCLGPPGRLLAAAVVFSVAGAAFMVVGASGSEDFVWAGVIFLAVGCAPILPTSLLWMAQHMRVTHRLCALMVVVSSFGNTLTHSLLAEAMGDPPTHAFVLLGLALASACLLAASVCALHTSQHNPNLGAPVGYQLASQHEEDSLELTPSASVVFTPADAAAHEGGEAGQALLID